MYHYGQMLISSIWQWRYTERERNLHTAVWGSEPNCCTTIDALHRPARLPGDFHEGQWRVRDYWEQRPGFLFFRWSDCSGWWSLERSPKVIKLARLTIFAVLSRERWLCSLWGFMHGRSENWTDPAEIARTYPPCMVKPEHCTEWCRCYVGDAKTIVATNGWITVAFTIFLWLRWLYSTQPISLGSIYMQPSCQYGHWKLSKHISNHYPQTHITPSF